MSLNDAHIPGLKHFEIVFSGVCGYGTIRDPFLFSDIQTRRSLLSFVWNSFTTSVQPSGSCNFCWRCKKCCVQFIILQKTRKWSEVIDIEHSVNTLYIVSLLIKYFSNKIWSSTICFCMKVTFSPMVSKWTLGTPILQWSTNPENSHVY